MSRTPRILSIVLGLALMLTAAPRPVQGQVRTTPPPAQVTPKPTPTPGRSTGPGRQGSRQDRLPWWLDEAVKKEIGLREDQSKRLSQLYDNRAKEIEPLNAEFRKQRDQLDKLMTDRTVSRSAIELQVSLMEAPRTKMNESFYWMLHRMYLLLDAEQYKKLQAIFERDRERGRGSL